VLALKFPVSGKFTGNSLVFGLQVAAATLNYACFQSLTAKFPADRNSE